MYFLCDLVVTALAAIASWWLSSFDIRLTDDNGRQDIIRRAIRCGITLLIVEVGFYGLWQWRTTDDRSAGYIFVAMILPVVILWKGCISEAGAHFFLHLIDPKDKQPYDPKAGLRELDAIGDLIRSDRKEEAIQLCRTLLQSSPEHKAAMELTLHHLGAPPPESPKQLKPLAAADRLRQTGKFNEAKTVLTSVLNQDPSNVDAALMLIRLYAQDLRQPVMAREVLQTLEKQPYVSAAYIEIARHSIISQSPPVPETVAEPLPESIEELLAKKYFGTAVERLEKLSEAEPANFEARIKLAEIHGLHCANIKLAEKTIRQIETNPAFTAEQKQQARNSLQHWRDPKTCPVQP